MNTQADVPIRSLGGAISWIKLHRTFSLGLAVTIVLIGCSVFAPFISPYAPEATDYDNRFLGPSLQHLMGTDAHGRDLFSRILYGGQVSILVSFSAVTLSALIGIPIGLTVGYFGGWADSIVSRLVDALFAFPSILWAIGIVAIIGPSSTSALTALAIARIPVTIRIARAAVISAKENEYVSASKALGSPWYFIVFRAILPNCAGPLTVLISLGLAVTILSEAGLGYLGLSVQPPTPSWGTLIQESQRYLRDSVWFSLFPGITLFVTVLALNLIGDGFRDLLDPRSRGS